MQLSNAELESLLEENESLRDEVRQLRGHAQHGGITKNPLCSRCYTLRLVLGALGGVLASGFAWKLLGKRETIVALQSAFGVHYDKSDMMIVGAIVTIALAIVPLATIAMDWKFRLYYSGHPGVLRAIAECHRAYREGRGLK